ncbi:MAG: threonine ammonia-lyase [Alphaproteobacteria bacterium]
MAVTFDDIRAAAGALDGVAVKTPLIRSPRLSERFGAEIFLKLESLQYTGSFKDRGAFVKLDRLSADERKAGVIAASTGNHAQGVAHHARRLGIPATIVMPVTTPFTKVEHTRRFGPRIVSQGETMAEATEFAIATAKGQGLAFIPAYDDPAIIAGQGTVGLEMLAAEPGLDTLIVPLGGGGLIAGIAIAAKHIKPDIAIYGVEAASFPAMHCALHGIELKSGGSTLADGIAVKYPGKLTQPVIREQVADVLLVDEEGIERAVETLLIGEKLLAEGAGAVPLAALEANRERFEGRKVGLVISGGNIDSRILSSILLRGLVRSGRLIRLRVELLDQPGALQKVAEVIAKSGANVVELSHQRLFSDVPIKHAELDLTIETRSPEHAREVTERITAAGFPTRLLSSRATGNSD